MNLRRASDLAVAVGVAVVLNLILLAGAALLARERPVIQDMTTPVAVNLVTLPPPETPPPEKPQEREKPEAPPRLDFRPELSSPALAGPPDLDLQVVLDPSLFAAGPDQGDLVFFAEDLDKAPSALVRTPPVYPFRARQREIEGSVQVKLLVRSDGSVGEFVILSGSPAGVFEAAVSQAVPQWKFDPGRLDGRPVDSWVITTVRFDLGN